MKKNLWASAGGPLKLALSILFCSFVSIIGSAQVSYAMSSKMLAPAATIPIVTDLLPTPRPQVTSTPTPMPTSTPTRVATQPPPQATPTPQPQMSPVPTTTVRLQSPTAAITPTVVATATSVVSAVPTTITATPSSAKPALSVVKTLPVQKRADQSNALVVSLMLGIGAPLLLISGGGMWWFLVRQKTNQNVPVWHEVTQANSWANSYTQQSSLYTHQSTSDLMPLAQVAGASGASSMPTPFIQPMYTPSRFRPITTAFLPQMLPAHAREEAIYPLSDDLRSFQIGSLDLSLNATRAIEANGNGQMPLHLASPTTLVDTPTSSMPSSPPATLTLSFPSSRH